MDDSRFQDAVQKLEKEGLEPKPRDVVTYPSGDLTRPHRDGIPINPGPELQVGRVYPATFETQDGRKTTHRVLDERGDRWDLADLIYRDTPGTGWKGEVRRGAEIVARVTPEGRFVLPWRSGVELTPDQLINAEITEVEK